MEYQTIKENGKVRFVVLPVNTFKATLDSLEEESDLRSIHEAIADPLYDQDEAEDYILMNPVKRERLEKKWTQEELASRIGVKQSTIAKWEKDGAIYRKATRQKLAKVFEIDEISFS